MKNKGGLRWWIVGMVSLATVINYIDRNALGILWPEISQSIGLDEDSSKMAYATISTVFLIAYAFSKGLSGRLFDIIGTRIGFVFSIVLWSVSAVLHAFATSPLNFSIFRGLLGIGEAGNWPGATKANAEWFPIKERAFAQGIFNSGASLGAVISAPLIALIFTWVGWKGTFILIGSLGLLWVIPWLMINKGDPSVHPNLSEEERNYILGGQKTDKDQLTEKGMGWMELMRYKETWAIVISRFMLDPIWWLFVIWLPIYLNDVFGFNVKEIGMFAWIPYVGAMIGGIYGGWLPKRFIEKGRSVSWSRKWIFIVSGAIMLLGLISAMFCSSALVAMLLIAVVLFGFQMAIGNLQTLPSDYFSGKSVGTLAGMGGTSAAIGSILLSTYLIPYLSEISYVPVFILGAILVPIGMGAIFILGGNIERVDLK